MNANLQNKGITLILGTAIISGFAVFINKIGVKDFNPYLFTFLRSVLVSALLVGLILGLKEFKTLKKLTKKDWLLLAVIGLVGGSIPFLLFFKGLSLTTAANGAFIHKTMFIYVGILAFVFLKEKIPTRFLIAGVLLLAGNLYFLKFLPYGVKEGDIFVLAATVFWAVENVISKYALRTLSPTIVAFGRMGIGALFILLFLIFTGNVQTFSRLTLVNLQWILVSSVILFGYVITWYTGLKYIHVSTATIILLLGSPITSVLTFIFQGQPFTHTPAVGSFLLVIGAALAIGFGTITQLVKNLLKLTYGIRT